MIERIFVVIPAYNAAGTIERVFARIPPAAAERISRVVVVDDGSSDGTAAVVGRIAAGSLKIDLLRHESNRGYGAAEKTLLRHALEEGAEVVLLLHADGQYSPEKIPAMLAPFDRGEADLVQGSRMLGGGALRGGMPLYKYVANKCLTAVENAAFGLKMAEYHSGYMAYRRPFLEAVPFGSLSDSFDFDLEMIVMAKVAGFTVAEVAIPTIYADEVSHLDPLRYGLDVLTVVRRYRGGHYHRLMEESGAPADHPPGR